MSIISRHPCRSWEWTFGSYGPALSRNCELWITRKASKNATADLLLYYYCCCCRWCTSSCSSFSSSYYVTASIFDIFFYIVVVLSSDGGDDDDHANGDPSMMKVPSSKCTIFKIFAQKTRCSLFVRDVTFDCLFCTQGLYEHLHPPDDYGSITCRLSHQQRGGW